MTHDNTAPTLSAFGNMPGGGVIALGLDERRGFDAVGVYDAADAQSRLAGQARNAVTPPLQVSFSTGVVDGNTAATTLSERQVRYAVSRLRTSELIEVIGGPGQSGTRYQRSKPTIRPHKR